MSMGTTTYALSPNKVERERRIGTTMLLFSKQVSEAFVVKKKEQYLMIP